MLSYRSARFLYILLFQFILPFTYQVLTLHWTWVLIFCIFHCLLVLLIIIWHKFRKWSQTTNSQNPQLECCFVRQFRIRKKIYTAHPRCSIMKVPRKTVAAACKCLIMPLPLCCVKVSRFGGKRMRHIGLPHHASFLLVGLPVSKAISP